MLFSNNTRDNSIQDITRWSNAEMRLIIFLQMMMISTWSAEIRSRAACGWHYELCITKLRLTLKKLGKTTTPLRYDLNQIPCNYTIQVTNRFKGLGLIDSVPEELWTEVCNTVHEVVIKIKSKKNKCKKVKRLSEEDL